jgi:hypothetical protein
VTRHWYLGNVLRAAEYKQGQRYGLDTVTILLRLHPIGTPEVVVRIIDFLRLRFMQWIIVRTSSLS